MIDDLENITREATLKINMVEPAWAVYAIMRVPK